MAIRAELRRELLQLPPDERQELAEALFESLDETVDGVWEAAWTDELAGRLQEIVDGKVALIDADDVHEELQAALRDQHE